MTLDEIDKSGLIREAYAIEGITAPECRSIFVDWAMKLPDGTASEDAIDFLLETYASGRDDHPMTQVLRDGLVKGPPAKRRGGWRSRAGRDQLT